MLLEKEIEKKALVVILLGPPGAGKGTQAKFLSKKLGVPHISTGDLFREHISNKSSLGSKAKAFMDAGHLVPDSLVLDMLFERVIESDCQKGYVLDGFPRTVAQAEALQDRLGENVAIKALYLKLDDCIILERLSNRLVCESCNSPFHLIYSPPKEEKTCDHCTSTLIQRRDDAEDVIRKRLEVYRQQTSSLISFYENTNHFNTISCDQPIGAIQTQILPIVGHG